MERSYSSAFNRGPLGSPLLFEGAKALLKIITVKEFVAHAAGDDAGGVPILTTHFMDEIEAAANGGWARFRQIEGNFHGALVGIGRDLMNQSVLESLLCVERTAREGQLHGLALADGGVHGAEDEKRPQAELDFGKRELCLFRSDG